MQMVDEKLTISDDYGKFITVLRELVDEHIKKTKELIQSSENDIKNVVRSAGENNEIPIDIVIQKSFVCKRCYKHIDDINTYLSCLDDRLFKNPYAFVDIFYMVREIIRDIDMFNREERSLELFNLTVQVLNDDAD